MSERLEAPFHVAGTTLSLGHLLGDGSRRRSRVTATCSWRSAPSEPGSMLDVH